MAEKYGSEEKIPVSIKSKIKCPRHRGPSRMRELLIKHEVMLQRDIIFDDIELVDMDVKEPLKKEPKINSHNQEISIPTKGSLIAIRLRKAWNHLNLIEKNAAHKRETFKDVLTSEEGTLHNECYHEGKYSKDRQIEDYDSGILLPYSP